MKDSNEGFFTSVALLPLKRRILEVLNKSYSVTFKTKDFTGVLALLQNMRHLAAECHRLHIFLFLCQKQEFCGCATMILYEAKYLWVQAYFAELSLIPIFLCID